MLERSCKEFIEVLSSKEPVPGGGGACALTAALGMALGSMVGNLTLGKKKYADVEGEMMELLDRSAELTGRLEVLVELDAEAFAPLAATYRMPSETEQEREDKRRKMQTALTGAAEVPLQIAECCLESLLLLERYAKLGSRLAVSDAGTGAAFCRSALQGAKLNVLINLKLMEDEALRKRLKNRLDRVIEEGLRLADEIYSYVEEELEKS